MQDNGMSPEMAQALDNYLIDRGINGYEDEEEEEEEFDDEL